MDREAFAKRLPEQAPAALTKWASTQESELGATAYTVYRCERRYQTPAMEDLFENRTRGSRYWATLCNCTVCGEEWYTRKGQTAASFFVIDGEDGNTYSAEPAGDPLYTTDELYYVEVTEGDSILCPFCGAETKVVKATTIGDGKTKRLQIAQLANIDGYTTIIYWLAENQIYQYGSGLTLVPRYAYALDEKGQIKAFSHRQYMGYSLDGEAPKWRPWDNTRDKWDALYCDWGSINGRKRGTVGFPSVPFDMEGTTGEKTGLAGYWQAAQGFLPLQYLRLWQKYPAVENLVNAGFSDLLGNILSDANRYGYDVVSETKKTLDLSKRRPHEKADTLLKIIGVGDQLYLLENKEKQLYNQRLYVGREADQKAKYAKEMPFYDGVPETPVSALELIQRQQEILLRNAENQKKRGRVQELAQQIRQTEKALEDQTDRLRSLLEEQTQTQYRLDRLREDFHEAQKTAQELQDESTAQLEADLQNIDAINIRVRANLDREKAEAEAQGYSRQYDALTEELEKTRQEKYELLHGARMPLEDLSVEDGELTYRGKRWDGMSGSEQLKVSTAIVRELNPRCGFVLLDKLEQMDLSTLQEFGAWLEKENLQAIATRVSTGGECSVIIEDGSTQAEPLPEIGKTWKDGVF